MHVNEVRAGLQQLFGRPVELPTPDRPSQPWLSDDPAQLYGSHQAHVGHRDIYVRITGAWGIGQTLIPQLLQTHGIPAPGYAESGLAAEFSNTGEREPAAYSLHALHDVLVAELGRFSAHGETALVLEDLGALAGIDPSGAVERWPTERIEAALVAAAGFHGPTAGREYRWTVQRPGTRTVLADQQLWRALLLDASQRLPQILTPSVLERRLALVDSISRWHPAKDVMPACLVHNHFNQRNVGFVDGRVVVLDWEFAAVNTPQRDVAELLTFTLDAHTEADELMHLLAVHWQALADNGMQVDPEVYARAAAAEFRVQSFVRMGLHFILSAAMDLPYLARINRTVDHLVGLTED
jgi:hypothetical protein